MPTSDHPAAGFRRAPIFTLSLPGDSLRLTAPHYAPEYDTVYATLHTEDWACMIRLVITGPEEQRRLLEALEPLVAELRCSLGLRATSEPSMAPAL